MHGHRNLKFFKEFVGIVNDNLLASVSCDMTPYFGQRFSNVSKDCSAIAVNPSLLRLEAGADQLFL